MSPLLLLIAPDVFKVNPGSLLIARQRLERGGLRTRRQKTDLEIAEEVESYLEESTTAPAASGLSEDEAPRVTQRVLGNATNIRG